jgi:hypothetical protein
MKVGTGYTNQTDSRLIDSLAILTAVILNEHLTEALRRLKRDASADSVDR